MRVVQDFGALTPGATSSHLMSILKIGGQRGDPDSRRRWCRILSIDRLAELCFADIVASRQAFPVCRCSLLPCLWQSPLLPPLTLPLAIASPSAPASRVSLLRLFQPCPQVVGRSFRMWSFGSRRSGLQTEWRWPRLPTDSTETSPPSLAIASRWWPARRRVAREPCLSSRSTSLSGGHFEEGGSSK